MNKLNRLVPLLLTGLTLLPTIALAQTGRLTVDADRAELDESQGYSVYSGNVQLQQQGIDLTGDRLTIRRPSNGQLRATMEGQPARLTHTPDNADGPITATASPALTSSESSNKAWKSPYPALTFRRFSITLSSFMWKN